MYYNGEYVDQGLPSPFNIVVKYLNVNQRIFYAFVDSSKGFERFQ